MYADVVIFFFDIHSKTCFMLRYAFFKFDVLYVLKTHCDCFNSQVNNFDSMEREPLFLLPLSNILEKLKVWL